MLFKSTPLFASIALITSAISLTGCSQPAQKTSDTKTEVKTETKTVSSTTTATSTTAAADTTATPNTGIGQKVTIGTESSFAPFSYKDAQGNLVGFEIDLAKAMCAEAKLECNVVSQDFDGLIPALQAKKIDAIMAGMSATPERSKVVAFSEPYYSNALIVVAKKGATINAADLNGKTVAAQRATVAADYIAEHFPKAQAKLYDTQESAYLDLESGRAEVLLSDKAPALAWLKTPKGQNFEVKGTPIDINDKIAIALRQNDPLIAKFNTALTTLKGNGTYDKISHQYFADIK